MSVALDVDHGSILLKLYAPANIVPKFVTLAVFHAEILRVKDSAGAMSVYSCTTYKLHDLKWSQQFVPSSNMDFIVTTEPVFHPDSSPSKAYAFLNIELISVALLVDHMLKY